MKMWKTAAVLAIAVAAAAIGFAVAPPVQGQTRVTPKVRALEMLSGGSRIGVSIHDVEDGDSKTTKGAATGVIVEEVVTESPAEKAGLRKGDVIVEFDGERVRSVRQLTRLVQETPAGRTVPAVLQREGQRTTVSITPRDDGRFSFQSFDDLADLGREFRFAFPRVAPPRPPTPPNAPAPPDPPPPPMVWNFDGLVNRGRLGISIDSLSPQLAEYFGTKDGVLVSSVSDDSAAAKAGMKAGDVITNFNGSVVSDAQDLRRRIQNLNDGDEFTVTVMRDRKPVTLKGKAERPERRRTYRTIL
jgi:serine protease Do